MQDLLNNNVFMGILYLFIAAIIGGAISVIINAFSKGKWAKGQTIGFICGLIVFILLMNPDTNADIMGYLAKLINSL